MSHTARQKISSSPFDQPDRTAATDPQASAYRHALVLINTRASRYTEFASVIRNHLAQRLAADIIAVDEADFEELRTTNVNGYDILFLAGGDGTINYCLPELIRTGLPLAVIPMGTANDFANTLSIPAHPVDAIDALLTGQEHHVDVGQVNGEYFINVASVGLGADVVREMDSTEKGWLGVLSYPMALVRAYRSARPLRVTATLDGTTKRLRVLHLAVGNGYTHGGGIYVGESPRIMDGLFNIYCVVPPRLWRVLNILYALLRRQHRAEPSLHTATAERVEINTGRQVDINIDGELKAKTPAVFEVRKGALRVVAPRDWKEEPIPPEAHSTSGPNR